MPPLRTRSFPPLLLSIVVVFEIIQTTRAAAQPLTVSGGADLRAGVRIDPDPNTLTGLSSVFLNLRTVYADDEGDRVFLVAQGDFEEELERSHFYQVYAQYKGPLGKWNVRVGRYLVPFGLHYYYDTERVLLAAHEAEALGLKLDEGVQVFGFKSAFDYSISVSRGFRNKATPMARLGWQDEGLRLGVSYLYGRLPSIADEESVGVDELLPGAIIVRRHRFAIDYEHNLGQWTLRAEPVAGADDGEFVLGGYAEVTRTLSASWDVAANAAIVESDLTGRRWRAGAGMSYRILPGVFVRGAYLYRDEDGATSHVVVGQIYAEFSQTLGGDE